MPTFFSFREKNMNCLNIIHTVWIRILNFVLHLCIWVCVTYFAWTIRVYFLYMQNVQRNSDNAVFCFQIIWMNPRRILFSNEDKIVIDDRRVGVEKTKEGDWNLRIQHVQHNDSGEYTCQINTSPVKIKRVRLHVEGKNGSICQSNTLTNSILNLLHFRPDSSVCVLRNMVKHLCIIVK